MYARIVHTAAVAGKLLSAVLAIVATAVFCYFLLHPASPTPSSPAPAQLGPAITTTPVGSAPAPH